MIDKLLEFAITIINDILPFFVIKHYNKGVRLRFGINKGVIEPGFHWKIPFVDQILTHMVKTTTINLSEQTITTKDWKSIVVRAVIKYEVENVEKLLLEVNDPIDAISDMTKGIIRNMIINKDWIECNNLVLAKEIISKTRNEAEKWGIRVKEVTLTDLGEMRSIRIFNSMSPFLQ